MVNVKFTKFGGIILQKESSGEDRRTVCKIYKLLEEKDEEDLHKTWEYDLGKI